MDEKQIKIIEDWIIDAKILLKCYLSKANKIKVIDTYLKIFSAIFSSLVITLVLILIRLELITDNFYIVVVSIIGAIASILSITVALLKLSDKANKCNSSGNEYATIRKELEYTLNFESEYQKSKELERIRKKWDYVRKNSIPITPKEIQRFRNSKK
jgi:hypothetical protein